MNTAPKRIYLDIGDQFALEAVASGAQRWDLLEGITWSEDNATSHGVPYVRADLVPTPAASRAATPTKDPQQIFGAALAEETLRESGGAEITLNEQDLTNLLQMAFEAGIEEANLEAAQPASPAPLTDEQERAAFEAASVEAGYHAPKRAEYTDGKYLFQRDEDRFVGWMLARALASPQVAPAPVPDGFALVPVRMTKAMQEVTDEEGWQWSDVLAAAETVDENAESWYSKAEDAIYGMEMEGYAWDGAEWRKATAPVQVAPLGFEPWLRTVCITAPPPQAYDLAKQAWGEGFKRGATAPVAPQDDARDAARYRFLRDMKLNGDEENFPCIRAADNDSAHWALIGEAADTIVDAAIRAKASLTPAAKPTESTQGEDA